MKYLWCNCYQNKNSIASTQVALNVLFISTFHFLDVESDSFEPPKGCTCIESTSEDGKNCYDTPAKCGKWDAEEQKGKMGHKFDWCYVADEKSCKVKTKGYCGSSYWAKCEKTGKLKFHLLLITT